MFNCPNCQTTLVRVQNNLGFYWGCPKCRGRAVSVSLLRRALRREYVNQLWGAAREGQGQPGRPCPACERPMLEVAVAANADSLKLDVCKPCEFVWFDATEYESSPSIPLLPKPPPPTPAETEARAKLAIYEARMLAEESREEWPDARWKTVPALFGLPVEFAIMPLKNLPWLTWSVAVIITLVSLVGFTNPSHAIQEFGLIPAQAWRDGGATLLTSFFLHGGWWHLIGNLYFLLVFGERVEDYLGWKRLLALLAISTLAGDILHILGDPHGDVPCIGASGGISGIIAFYALKFPRARLGFLPPVWLGLMAPVLWLRGYFGWIRVPAWGAFAIWIALQLLGTSLQLSGYGGTSALAHLGGATVGISLWLWWKRAEARPALVRTG